MLSRMIEGRQAAKVFAIGFNKTGTTSLHRIFGDLGYRSYHGTKWRNTTRPAIYRFYDAFCDGVPDDFRRLDAMFPKARFILQVRDLDTWLDSRLEHIQRLPKNGRKRAHDWTASDDSVASWVRKRNEYHRAVLTHFRDRPGDLLLVNFIRDPDAARKIAVFLGHAGGVEKPHANRNPKGGDRLKNGPVIEQVLTEMGIPRSEWQTDIHCPSLRPEAGRGIPADTSQV